MNAKVCGGDAARGAADALGAAVRGCVQLDAHCHLQHDPHFVTHANAHPSQHFFCMSETPHEYAAFAPRALPANVHAGLGLHPWQVSEAPAETDALLHEFLRLLPIADLVGEVGLDFSAKHVHTKRSQLSVFREIAKALAAAPALPAVPAAVQAAGMGAHAPTRAASAPAAPAAATPCEPQPAAPVAPLCEFGPAVPAAVQAAGMGANAPIRTRVISVHAVRAAGWVLDILQDAGCLESCTCVFHWFSGTSDELARARRAGCYFSFSPRALATRRGRAYAAQIPPSHLLRESDAFSLDACE